MKNINIFTNGIIKVNHLLVLSIGLCSSFTTIVQLIRAAFLPSLSDSLGVFLPLIVVNCIIMGRVESFASKNTPFHSVLDALGMGIGYTWVLCAISIIREFFGAGTFFGIKLIPDQYCIGIFTQAPGGFLVFGAMIAIVSAIEQSVNQGE